VQIDAHIDGVASEATALNEVLSALPGWPPLPLRMSSASNASAEGVLSDGGAADDEEGGEAVRSTAPARSADQLPASDKGDESREHSDSEGDEDDDDVDDDAAPVKMRELEVVDWLGKGAVGKVYLVRHVVTKELYAVKALSKRAMLQKKKGVAHAMQELTILCSCAHPFVINLVASFQTKHWLCHLMEFCPRGHFYSLLQSREKKRLPEEHAKFYAAEILSGIEYLHFKGFIYRDMKPENILVAASGHLRLTDFDLSQTVRRSATPMMADQQGIGVSQQVHDQRIVEGRLRQHEARKKQQQQSGHGTDPMEPPEAASADSLGAGKGLGQSGASASSGGEASSSSSASASSAGECTHRTAPHRTRLMPSLP
jgi:hypothetical protein